MSSRGQTIGVFICIVLACHATPLAATEWLDDAILAGNLEKIDKLLDVAPELIDACDSSGRKWIHLAARMGKKQIVDIFLKHGAKIDIFIASELGLKDQVASLLR